MDKSTLAEPSPRCPACGRELPAGALSAGTAFACARCETPLTWGEHLYEDPSPAASRGALLGWGGGFLGGTLGTAGISVAVGYEWGSVRLGLLYNLALWAALLLMFFWLRRRTRHHATLLGFFFAGSGIVLALLAAPIHHPLYDDLLAAIPQLRDSPGLVGPSGTRGQLLWMAALSVVIGVIIAAIARARVRRLPRI